MPLSLDGTTGISASGNITAAFLFGNGSQLSGVDATQIVSGTSNVRVVSSGGNVTAGIGGTSNVMVIATTGVFVTGVASASGNITGANILTAGLISATGNITGGNVLGGANVNATTHTGTTVSVTGNITGGNILTGGLISATSTVTSAANVIGGNITTAGIVTATGNVVSGANLVLASNIIDTGALEIITGSNGNITLSPNGSGVIVANKDIRNGQANGVGNIGTTGAVFNTVFAKATSAQYADVAEKYVADRVYPAGTVLEIGGAAEVQETTTYASTRIAGVVSTNPALIMNSGERDTNAVEVALLGRVPCRVTGTIQRGDLITSSDRPGVATALRPGDYRPGCVIGKALEAHATASDGLIEVLVGRL